MWKLFIKYELQFKIFALAAWTIAAIDNILFDDTSKNKNFDLFVGIIMLLLAIFYSFEVIALVKKKKRKKQAGQNYRRDEEYDATEDDINNEVWGMKF